MTAWAKICWFLVGIVAGWLWLAYSAYQQGGYAILMLFVAITAFAISAPQGRNRRKPPSDGNDGPLA